MAILFLVFAFADLGTTLPCCGDELGLPLAAAESHAMLAREGGNAYDHDHVNLPSSDERSPARPSTGVDGCFCCALAVPTAPLAIETLRYRDSASELRGFTLPTSAPRTPYHPPRFA
jgi:hypothetical protein